MDGAAAARRGTRAGRVGSRGTRTTGGSVRMKTSIIVLLAAALLLPRIASAEAPSTPGRDRARTFLVIRMAEELDLSDEKALQVSGVLRRSEDRRRELTAQRDQIESQLRAALEHSPPNDA